MIKIIQELKTIRFPFARSLLALLVQLAQSVAESPEFPTVDNLYHGIFEFKLDIFQFFKPLKTIYLSLVFSCAHAHAKVTKMCYPPFLPDQSHQFLFFPQVGRDYSLTRQE